MWCLLEVGVVVGGRGAGWAERRGRVGSQFALVFRRVPCSVIRHFRGTVPENRPVSVAVFRETQKKLPLEQSFARRADVGVRYQAFEVDLRDCQSFQVSSGRLVVPLWAV